MDVQGFLRACAVTSAAAVVLLATVGAVAVYVSEVLGGMLAIAVGVGGAAVAFATDVRREDLPRQRRERGQCLACGYDLRGNTSGVCPECGAKR
jgi:hypothetical protein